MEQNRRLRIVRGTGRAVDVAEYVGARGWKIADEPELPCFVTALEPTERRTLVESLRSDGAGFAHVPVLGSAISPTATFGIGTMIADGVAFVGSWTKFGEFVLALSPLSVGHDTVIGNFVTIHPSATISGHVVIEDEAVIGAGAVIVHGRADRPLRIGRGARIEAGAVVTTAVADRVIVGGNPARPYRS
jgi:acetyltransferase-like isoleucine patch superfamily enzyme